jgi:hypothetical protein
MRSLVRAFLVGSFWHFLAGVAGPVVIAASAAALQTRSLTAEVVWMMPAVIGLALGVLFLFHEIVVLAALAYLRRRARATPPQTDLAVDVLTAVIGTDLVALGLGAATLAWLGMNKFGELVPVLGLFAPALYGTYLLARWVRSALPAERGPAQVPAGPSSDMVQVTARDPALVGLQVYVTAAVAILAFAGLRWRQDLVRTMAIGFVSIVIGRVVVMAVLQKERRE